MKKAFLYILTFCLFSLAGNTQNVRLNGYGTYVFDDHVDSYYSNTAYFDGKIKGGFRWGAGIEYMLAPTYGLELQYLHQDTEVPLTYYDNGEKSRAFDLSANWLMLAGARYLQKDKFEPYVGFMMGAVFYSLDNPVNGTSSSDTKFAYGFRLGSNLFFSQKVGIKLQADVISAAQAVGGSFYFGTGGAGTGVSTFSTIWQFALGGGLVFRFGGNTPTTTTTTKPNY